MIKRYKKNVRNHFAVFEWVGRFTMRNKYYIVNVPHSKSSGGLIYHGGRFTL
jgi:hypothetical protein